MRTLRRLIVTALLLVAIPSLLASVAFVIGGRPSQGLVAPNVFIGQQNVSGMNQAALSAAVSAVAAEYEDATLTIVAADNTAQIPTAAIGLNILEGDTAKSAMAEGRSGNFAVDVVSFIGSYAQPRRVEVKSSFDRRALDEYLVKGDPGERTAPVEPRLTFANGALKVVEGKAGKGITSRSVGRALPDALRQGMPFRVTPQRGEIEPLVSDAEAKVSAGLINTRLAPLPVSSNGTVGTIAPDTYGPWLRTDVVDRRLRIYLDAPTVNASFLTLLPAATKAPVEPAYVVVGTQPRIAPAKDGSRCCDPAAVPVIESALRAQFDGQPPTTPVDLPFVVLPPVNDLAALEALKITTRIGTFTTYHPAGQPRVVNIHQMADTVRGHIIKPGETFSLNTVVGPRTLAKGYVVDGVISDAKFAKSVGGGVSQFATTIFNAAFFGGLEFGEYQSHSIFINRYPYGREATISHPHPDLQIKNITPYGVLVWPTYNNVSITVSLYSTPFATGEQTGQSETTAGACTRVRTERTRTFVDGRRTTDAVYALYQPAEGVRC